MAVDVNSALTKAYDELRTIDTDLSMLSGVSDRFNRKRSAPNNDSFSSPFDRHVQDGGRRIIIGPESSDRYAKRGRYAADEGPPSDYSPPSSARTQRTLQSSVVMPTIETKSRAAVINEMKKNEKKEDQVRNRRLFGNLLVGTLRQFQKEETTVGSKGQVQIDKQREVERRLEETEKENRNRLMREREALMAKKREKEVEIQALRRQKAIEQSAEEKTKHFNVFSASSKHRKNPRCSSSPPNTRCALWSCSKSHRAKLKRSLNYDVKMDRELRRLDTYTSAGAAFGGAIGQAKNAAEESDDQEENETNVRGGLKSAIVVKVEGGGTGDEPVAEETAELEKGDEEAEEDTGAENAVSPTSVPDFHKLAFALLSGLPNEISFGLNIITVLFHPGPFVLNFAHCPQLFSLLVALCGVCVIAEETNTTANRQTLGHGQADPLHDSTPQDHSDILDFLKANVPELNEGQQQQGKSTTDAQQQPKDGGEGGGTDAAVKDLELD